MSVPPIQDPRLAEILQVQRKDPIANITTPCIDCAQKHFEVFNIFFFDFFAMTLFSFCVIAFNGITTFPGIWIVWIGMSISLATGATFGWGHINPAVTLACMIKKENRTSIFHGVLLIISQTLGAFAGTFIAWGGNKNLIAPFPIVHSLGSTLETLVEEFLASTIFVLCILILVSTDLRPTQTPFQIWIAIPLCLIAVCVLFSLTLGTNPAQALAFQVAYFIFHPDPNSNEQLGSIWSVLVGASLGGVNAALLFEYVYRRYFILLKQQTLFLNENSAIKAQFLPKYEQVLRSQNYEQLNTVPKQQEISAVPKMPFRKTQIQII